MNLNELVGHTRCQILRDTVHPQLWSDAELIKYLNEAQDQFARRTHCLYDDTSEFTNFKTVVGEDVYTLDKRIIFISEAGIILSDANNERTWHELWDGTRGQVRRTFSKGKPTRYTAQVARNTIRLSPTPDAEYRIQLMVARKPLRKMSKGTDEAEIDDDYQLALCDYAAWRALSNNDPDGSNMKAAADSRAAYDLQVRDTKRNVARLHGGSDPQARTNWTGKRRRC